ncbi:MAG: CcmD family protein [Bacteroidetes bacterium]|nr:MAG: CcmD family protein [Bacteroidota bacterium]
MKKYKAYRLITFIVFLAISLPAALAEGNRDFMRETGKINVVVAVILVIFLGIVWYLFRLERKLTKLEHQTKDDQ